MKNEKFCFKKSTGFIALVGIILVGSVFAMNAMTSEKQSTGAKAYLACPNTSLPDYSGLCPKAWVAHNADGTVATSTNLLGVTHKCCYFATNYTGVCPHGSSPDPGNLCNPVSKFIVGSYDINGAYVTRKSDNKKVQCCNFIDVFTSNNGTNPTVAPTLTAVKPGGREAMPSAAPTTFQQYMNNVLVPTLQKTVNTENPYILQDAKYCTDLGLSQVPTLDTNGLITPKQFVNDYYKKYCSANETQPKWNGTYGAGAKCFTATGVCASSATCDKETCLRGISNTEKCLNIQVDFKKCVAAGKAPMQADPKTPDSQRCTGTCANDTAIGKCPVGYKRRCTCTYATTGLLYPKFVDDSSCP